MNKNLSRRHFLTEVGQGTLLATIGPALAAELGIGRSWAADVAPALHFGALEPLVCFMQETPVEKLQPALAGKLREGTPLKRLVAAGVLANARTFGGEDYIGFHTLMAMYPAFKMAALMPSAEAALPVFKVLYRNTNRIQENGGRDAEVLRSVSAEGDKTSPGQLHAAVRAKDTGTAERIFAKLMHDSADMGLNALLECVEDDTEVHRTVLPYRAWDLLDLVGQEHATTMLRMSLRYCLNAEKYRRPEWEEHSKVLTRLLDEHKLHDRAPGAKKLEDAELEKLSVLIFSGEPSEAAGAVAEALGAGFDPHEIGEALSLAANQLVLRDHGRLPEWESPGKPCGSVHGDSVGVHASDSVHAWRNLSSVSQGRNVHACLILGSWQIARDRGVRKDFLDWQPVPSKHHLNALGTSDPAKLLAALNDAIRQNMQSQASAAVQAYGALNLPVQPLLDVLLRYAVSEDGALHAEKYFQTTRDEFERTRGAFRWRHLVALARVTASEYGRPAAGQAEARELMGVKV